MATESDLEKKCRDHAESLGGRLIKVRTPGTKGFPDRLLLLPRQPIKVVEFKHPGGTGRLSPLQRRWLKELRWLGIPVWECVSFFHFTSIICKGCK